MNELKPPESGLEQASGQRFRWKWLLIVGGVLALLLGLLWRGTNDKPASASSIARAKTEHSAATLPRTESARSSSKQPRLGASATAEEIVTRKLGEFARNRRKLAHALARQSKVDVPVDVERFFDAVESGTHEEIEARFKVLNGGFAQNPPGLQRPPEVQALWPAIIDALGAAEQVHSWPAQKLLDYGHAVLSSLRPGMIYVGGTDPGRWIPELLTETSEGERHIVITQNGLADRQYQEYINLLYGDQLPMFTAEESERAFQDYIADAQKRLEHDQQFPDEPKQIRPGEDVKVIDGRVQVSGQTAVMAINEKLFQHILEKNPDASFAMEESFPLKSLYADATPLGPIMELRVEDATEAFNGDRAAESVQHWRATTQELLGDPEASASSEVRKTYSHMAVAQGNLLADRNFTGEAEQTYRLSTQIWPGNPEAVSALSTVLSRTGRADEAAQLLSDFVRKYPDQKSAVQILQASNQHGTSPAPTLAP